MNHKLISNNSNNQKVSTTAYAIYDALFQVEDTQINSILRALVMRLSLEEVSAIDQLAEKMIQVADRFSHSPTYDYESLRANTIGWMGALAKKVAGVARFDATYNNLYDSITQWVGKTGYVDCPAAATLKHIPILNQAASQSCLEAMKQSVHNKLTLAETILEQLSDRPEEWCVAACQLTLEALEALRNHELYGVSRLSEANNQKRMDLIRTYLIV